MRIFPLNLKHVSAAIKDNHIIVAYVAFFMTIPNGFTIEVHNQDDFSYFVT